MPKLRLVWKPSSDTARDPAIDLVCIHIAALHDRHLPLDEMTHLLTHCGDHWETTLDLPEDIISSILLTPLTTTQYRNLSQQKDSRHRFIELKKRHTTTGLHAEGNGFRLHTNILLGPTHAPRPGWETPEKPHIPWQHNPTQNRWQCGPHNAPLRLILLDGAQWAHTTLPTALHQLCTRGDLPPLDVHALDTSTNRTTLLGRNPDTTATLLTLIHQDPRPTIIAGQSLGALQILDTILKAPTTPLHAICLSPSLWYPRHDGPLGGSIGADLESTTAHLAGHTLYLAAGTKEGKPPAMAHTMDAHLTHVAHLLSARGATVATDLTCAAHELCAWEGALTRGLVWTVSTLTSTPR